MRVIYFVSLFFISNLQARSMLWFNDVKCKISVKEAGLRAVEEIYGQGIYSSDEATILESRKVGSYGKKLDVVEYWSPFDVPRVYILVDKRCHILSTDVVN
jgi:hypothetical protein